MDVKALPRFANDIVIIDETEPCPYLDGQTARMPLRMPAAKISLEEADERLEDGHRRTGEFVYKTHCPGCQACQPVRVDCNDFVFSRNQRRILRRNDRLLHTQIGPLVADPQRLELFNEHRRVRGLARRDRSIDQDEYVWGFVRSCFDSFEISYWLAGELKCLAICDRGQTSLSAVYTFYDPCSSSLSLGTYSILKQIKFCQEHGLRYLYLGYYVAESPQMMYKRRYLPQERLIGGKWVRIQQTD
jgi:arginine-tRNA-protein transferase